MSLSESRTMEAFGACRTFSKFSDVMEKMAPIGFGLWCLTLPNING